MRRLAMLLASHLPGPHLSKGTLGGMPPPKKAKKKSAYIDFYNYFSAAHNVCKSKKVIFYVVSV